MASAACAADGRRPEYEDILLTFGQAINRIDAECGISDDLEVRRIQAANELFEMIADRHTPKPAQPNGVDAGALGNRPERKSGRPDCDFVLTLDQVNQSAAARPVRVAMAGDLQPKYACHGQRHRSGEVVRSHQHLSELLAPGESSTGRLVFDFQPVRREQHGQVDP